MAFHETRFPVDISFGSTGGPERLTEIVTLASGHEERNTPWSHSRRRYDAGIGMRSLDDVAEVVAFFEARMGRLHGFRWKDWSDFKSCLPSGRPAPTDQVIGTGDGERTDFQLVKSYGTNSERYVRPITKPVRGSVFIALDGEMRPEDMEWTINEERGIVTWLVAPAEGRVVSAGYEFDVPVRFDADAIMTSAATFEAGEIPDIPLIEVRT